MTFNPLVATSSQIADLSQRIGAKADASTVAGLAATVATKIDATALQPLTTILAAKADSATVTSLASTVATKANASDLTALTTTVGQKATTAALNVLAATVPVPATVAPKAEATAPSAGTAGLAVSQADHQHPRLTSTTYGTIGATGTTTITFTRSFVSAPGVVLTEVGGVGTQPAVFRVDSWVQTNGAYTGCVVRAWRAQVMPTLAPVAVGALLAAVITAINAIVTSLSAFNIFAAPATGTVFSCVAIQRSDQA